MSVVAVAGGHGDLGRLITNALLATGKHEVYIMSRKEGRDALDRISPLTGKRYHHVIQTDYSSSNSLTEQLTEYQINVVICAFIMDSDSASEAQLRLIRAAEQCTEVRRFIPSEFNVEYDVGDNILPYPEKRFHLAARRELENTRTLEYTYVYPGMFMDYFGLPRVASSLRPLCFFIDPIHGQAVLPGDGEARMSMTFTTDAARYIALALDLDHWPRVLTTATSTVTLNELVGLVEKSQGRKLQVRYQPIEKLLRHEAIDLPTNVDIAEQYPERFPEGLDQLRGLIADLEAGVALGAFDFGKLEGHLDLVKAFEAEFPAPRRIEEVVEEAWNQEWVRAEN
ncbi:NAD(P)-binding protein [Thozetella sp. PMI_491]|nr:NAD(P)-binding protein [Thozetella sp. PMI_491]